MNIDQILPKVLYALQHSTQLRPTVYAELEPGGLQAFPIFHFEGDGRMKAHTLFVEGRGAGKQHRDSQILSTCFATETWLTEGQPNPNPGHKPPASVPHKEAVILALVENKPSFQITLYMYEMKRKKGKVASLVDLGKQTDERWIQAIAFLAGWHSRAMSDEEVRARQPRGMRAFLAHTPE